MKTSGEWSQIHLEPATEGWVLARELISSGIYQEGQALLKQLSSQPVQAVAHAAGPVNIHTEPSRHAPVLGKLMQGEKLEVFNRKLVPRPSAKAAPGRAPASPPRLDAWYLVRSGSRAGWLLGRLASLDIPPAIAQYAANYNLVAWFVLNTVTDEGQQVPQYLVADRVNSEKFDFTHIRVFTWSLTQHHYVTAYVESNLKGRFPIQVEHLHGVPYFRLRLVGRNGSKFQKIYRLSDTIVRPAGTVEGWESSAMPSSSRRRARR